MQQSGFAALTWQQLVMFLVSFVLIYLAIVKQFEPLLLLPIAFGMFLTNLPLADLMKEADPWYNSGVLRIIYSGIKSNLFPCLIFMGIGAMTDFGPLIANPISLPAPYRFLLQNRLLQSPLSAAPTALLLFISQTTWLPNCWRRLRLRRIHIWR